MSGDLAPTARDLDGFRAWFLRRGGAASSLKQYLVHLKRPRDRLVSRKLSPSTRRVCLGAWRSYAKFAKNVDLIEELAEVRLPVAARVRAQRPLPPKVFTAFRRELVAGAVDYLPPAMIAELGLMAGRGMRRGDVLRLKHDEVDEALKTDLLNFEAKGGKRLEWGVLPSFRPYLELLADQRDWDVVLDLFGASQETVDKQVAAAVRKVAWNIERKGVSVDDFRPHVLRRSYAVSFYAACGKDIMALTGHMGWSSPTVAARYIDHARREELDQIATKMFEEDD